MNNIKIGNKLVKNFGKPYIIAEACINHQGNFKLAEEMISYTHQWRDDNGAYWMGRQYELEVFWPKERPPWTSAAVILAYDAIYELSNGSSLFLDDLL